MSLERRTKRVSTATGFCKKKKVHIACIDLVYDIFLKRQEIKNLCKVFLWTYRVLEIIEAFPRSFQKFREIILLTTK